MSTFDALTLGDFLSIVKIFCRTYDLNTGDQTFKLTNNHVSVKRYQNTIYVEDIIPNVIEPSFGKKYYSNMEVKNCLRPYNFQA